MTTNKIVPDKDVALLIDLMNAPYDPEPFTDACISVIFINHFKLPWNSDVDVVETAELMKKHIIENGGTAFHYDWTIEDGVLYVDGKLIKRVGSSTRKYAYDPEADYWEARCLSMGEPVD